MSEGGERSCAEGRLVVLPLPCDARLHPEEEALVASAKALSHRSAFLGGRTALRRALGHFGLAPAPILKDDRGAPVLPPGYVGTISHKTAFAVALASPADGFSRGIDIEVLRAPRTDIADRILREEEMHAYAALATDDAMRTLIRSFSIKEAVYKAIDPYLKRYVDYRECRVTLGEQDEARIELFLKNDEPSLECYARSFIESGHVIAIARARAIHRAV